MSTKDRQVRIHREEMESILNLKSRLDHQETVSSFAEKYQHAGWILQAVDPQDGNDLEVNSGEHPENWLNRLGELGLSGPKINLAVHTGKGSGLMVLEVANGPGKSSLDQHGPWQAECIAALGAVREQHFYAWDPSPIFDSVSALGSPEIRWFGEGQVVPVPPAFDPETQETWRWLSPPWEKPPQPPSQSLLFLLEQHFTRGPQPRPEPSLSWQEVYCLASPFEPLLQALAATSSSMHDYYQRIIEAALAAGIKSPEPLLSLLWHAPRGNAALPPAIGDYLQELVAKLQFDPGAATSLGNMPWEFFLDNAMTLVKATAAGGSDQPAGKPGPTGFLQRSLANPLPSGPAHRTPFSCRPARGNLRTI
jgi:hypothetical protein